MWDYICPKCRKEVEKNSSKCPHCRERYGSPIRVPPQILKDPKALEKYIHKHVFPRVSKEQREYLAQYFTEFLNSGWEDSGGTDVTDDGKWDGTSVDSGCTLEVQSTTKYAGTYAAHAIITSGNRRAYIYKDFTAQSTAYSRVYVRFSSFPASGDSVTFNFLAGSVGWVQMVEVYNDSGTVKWRLYYHNGTSHTGGLTETLETDNPSLDTWYCVEQKYVQDASSGEARVYINGVEKITKTGLNTSSAGSAGRFHSALFGRTSNLSGNVEVYVDSCVVADTYIGPETAEQTYTKTWATDALFKKLGITKTLGVDVVFAYKVRLPELWLDENGKLVLNISKPYTWVGT